MSVAQDITKMLRRRKEVSAVSDQCPKCTNVCDLRIAANNTVIGVCHTHGQFEVK